MKQDLSKHLGMLVMIAMWSQQTAVVILIKGFNNLSKHFRLQTKRLFISQTETVSLNPKQKSDAKFFFILA